MDVRSPYDFETELESPVSAPRSSLERTAQIVAVLSGIVATVVGISSLRKGSPWYLSWILLTFVVLLVGSVLYPPLRVSYHAWIVKRADSLVGRQSWPKFVVLVRRFGEFVSERTDTLDAVISNNVPEPMRSEFNKLVVNSRIFSGFYHFLAQRVDRRSPGLPELASILEEFHHLVGLYGNFCIAPVFDRLSEEQRKSLPDQAKAKLNTFRERYGQFLTEYMEFAKQLADSRPQLRRLPRYLPYPTQL